MLLLTLSSGQALMFGSTSDGLPLGLRVSPTSN